MGRKWRSQIKICDGCGHDTPRTTQFPPYLCYECEGGDVETSESTSEKMSRMSRAGWEKRRKLAETKNGNQGT